jgi:predicted lipoprotein with Yx(FWY)xxD motif
VNRTSPALASLALVALLALAGCGGSDNGSSSGSGGAYGSGEETAGKTATSGSSSAGAAAAISAAGVADLGRVLVDSKGLTLYDFHKDKGGNSACYGPCAEVWPPLTTGSEPQAGEGATASKLGTTKRKDGTLQVTYAGHPLYTYSADTKPGEAKGNDVDSFGAEWYALEPSGEEAEG